VTIFSLSLEAEWCIPTTSSHQKQADRAIQLHSHIEVYVLNSAAITLAAFSPEIDDESFSDRSKNPF
jgi:hypothetical protein